jgi:hypothetical protein
MSDAPLVFVDELSAELRSYVGAVAADALRAESAAQSTVRSLPVWFRWRRRAVRSAVTAYGDVLALCAAVNDRAVELGDSGDGSVDEFEELWRDAHLAERRLRRLGRYVDSAGRGQLRSRGPAVALEVAGVQVL